MLADERQVDLAQQLVVQADPELLGGHLRQRTEMQGACGGDDGVDLADALEQGADAVTAGDVDLVLALGLADGDDVVALAEFVGHGAADGAAGADKKDLHGEFRCSFWGADGAPAHESILRFPFLWKNPGMVGTLHTQGA